MTLFSKYQEETRALTARLMGGSQVVDTRWGAVEFGQSGAGPAVVLSHGSMGGYDMGLWLGSLLGPGFHYIAPSRFGYLRTPLPVDSSAEAQAGQYAALLDTLGIDRAAIVGLSAGGPSALQFALCYPDRCAGLVMLSAVSRRYKAIPWLFKALFFGLMKINFLPWLLLRHNPASVYQSNGVSRSLYRQISRDPEKKRFLDELGATSLLPAIRRVGMMNDFQRATRMSPYPLDRIHLPTLVVHAVNDPVVPIAFGRFSAAQIPGARMLEVEDGGHFCCITHRENVVPAITHFLQSTFSLGSG